MNAHTAIKTLLSAALIVSATLIPFQTRASEPGKESGKMIHVGLIWLKKPGDAVDRKRLIDALHRFAREIPEIRSLTVGQPHASASKLVDSSFDVAFTMQFDDAESMGRYGKHPAHEKAAREAFLPLSAKLLFFDYVNE